MSPETQPKASSELPLYAKIFESVTVIGMLGLGLVGGLEKAIEEDNVLFLAGGMVGGVLGGAAMYAACKVIEHFDPNIK